MNTAVGPSRVTSSRDLEALLDRTCWLEGHHIVLHDTTSTVWVAHIAPGGEFLATAAWTGPTDDARDPAWMAAAVTPVPQLPTWRFPMTVLHAPPPLDDTPTSPQRPTERTEA